LLIQTSIGGQGSFCVLCDEIFRRGVYRVNREKGLGLNLRKPAIEGWVEKNKLVRKLRM
jgi:hypothetical protein